MERMRARCVRARGVQFEIVVLLERDSAEVSRLFWVALTRLRHFSSERYARGRKQML